MKGLYVPLQTRYYLDDKILAAGEAAELLYVRALGLVKDAGTDGIIMAVQLPFLGLSDFQARTDRLVAVGLWQPVDGGYLIVSWLKHNDPIAVIDAKRQKHSESGKAGARKRWGDGTTEGSDNGDYHSKRHSTGNGTCNSQCQASPNGTVSLSSLCDVRSTEGVQGGGSTEDTHVPRNGSEPAIDPGYTEDSPYEPDDPAYSFDPQWHAEKELAYWQKQLGKIPGGQLIYAENALKRLHSWCRLSLPQIRALVKLCVEDAEARNWWGKGKSPATWLDNRTGNEPLWVRIRAHAIQLGRYPAAADAKPAGPPDPGPDPGVDKACDCRRGWIEDMKRGVTTFCPKCARGKWLKAGGRDK